MHSSGSRQLQAPFERLTDATETEFDEPQAALVYQIKRRATHAYANGRFVGNA